LCWDRFSIFFCVGTGSRFSFVLGQVLDFLLCWDTFSIFFCVETSPLCKFQIFVRSFRIVKRKSTSWFNVAFQTKIWIHAFLACIFFTDTARAGMWCLDSVLVLLDITSLATIFSGLTWLVYNLVYHVDVFSVISYMFVTVYTLLRQGHSWKPPASHLVVIQFLLLPGFPPIQFFCSDMSSHVVSAVAWQSCSDVCSSQLMRVSISRRSIELPYALASFALNWPGIALCKLVDATASIAPTEGVDIFDRLNNRVVKLGTPYQSFRVCFRLHRWSHLLGRCETSRADVMRPERRKPKDDSRRVRSPAEAVRDRHFLRERCVFVYSRLRFVHHAPGISTLSVCGCCRMCDTSETFLPLWDTNSLTENKVQTTRRSLVGLLLEYMVWFTRRRHFRTS